MLTRCEFLATEDVTSALLPGIGQTLMSMYKEYHRVLVDRKGDQFRLP
jgi:hypothetical protein